MQLKKDLIKCKECGVKFTPINQKQIFHNTNCRNIWFNRKNKQELIKSFPQYRCPYCNKMFKLNFNPIKDYLEIKKLICPFCKEKIIKNK